MKTPNFQSDHRLLPGFVLSSKPKEFRPLKTLDNRSCHLFEGDCVASLFFLCSGEKYFRKHGAAKKLPIEEIKINLYKAGLYYCRKLFEINDLRTEKPAGMALIPQCKNKKGHEKCAYKIFIQSGQNRSIRIQSIIHEALHVAGFKTESQVMKAQTLFHQCFPQKKCINLCEEHPVRYALPKEILDFVLHVVYHFHSPPIPSKFKNTHDRKMKYPGGSITVMRDYFRRRADK